MEQLNNKVDNSGATAQGVLPSAEWNQPMSEIQNVITQTGQSLSSGDLEQLGKGLAAYAANGNLYTSSGAANTFELAVIGTKQSMAAYEDGQLVVFFAHQVNTGAVTTNVNTIGSVALNNIDGTALIGDEIQASNVPTFARYNSGDGGFRLEYRNGRQFREFFGPSDTNDRLDLEALSAGFQTIGPTGSGADFEWDNLDAIPVGARGIIARVDTMMNGTDTSGAAARFFNLAYNIKSGDSTGAFIHRMRTFVAAAASYDEHVVTQSHISFVPGSDRVFRVSRTFSAEIETTDGGLLAAYLFIDGYLT